jgi:membrane protease YdiL (CAAX protease family)
MIGISSWTILGPIVQPWPYRLLFYGLAVTVLMFLSSKHADKKAGYFIATKRFGIALLGGQFLAFMATVIFVTWGLKWRLHPDPSVIEDWVGMFWHFYVDIIFSETGLGLTVLGLVWVGDITWHSVGVIRPNISIPLMLVVVAASYFILNFGIRPVSLNLWKHSIDFFDAGFSQSNFNFDQPQWNVWSLREANGQIGIFGPILTVLFFGVLTPIIEEMFFRGLLFMSLLERTSTWVALVVQALLFAAIHIDLVRLPYLIIFGLILGYLTKRTSSLIPAVLLHFVVNTVSIVEVLT